MNNSKTIKISLISLGFASSYVLGDFVRARIIRKKLYKVIPLVQNCIIDVMTKSMQENLSREDTNKLMDNELEFIRLVMK